MKNVVVANQERYNVPKELYVPVKPEDLDWTVYHLILAGKASEMGAIIEETGCTREEAGESIRRLVSYCLVDNVGDRYEALSVPDIFLRSQCKYADDMPIVIENGVVKPKKPVQ
jgi:hypothetical protein